ncbi:hypothetical protein GJ744_006125 [Endocarpon pusillum]|uniref:Uncharacterized protein n=1 Tax=Endocarpon pusillum TaxID=364733 RepID=A0A8H7E515_9EURO|nr:hypothetical protein GJ744_006125 [Endocarpon pusillum]
MSEGPSDSDRDLLSRLNALKQSRIDLDAKQLTYPKPTPLAHDIDPLVGHALHADISARFRALQGTNGPVKSVSIKTKSGTSLDIPELRKGDNDKTVEELLAELGPEEEWEVDKCEDDQVRDVLKEAQDALKGPPDTEKNDDLRDIEPGAAGNEQQKQTARTLSIDLSVFQPEPDSDVEDSAEAQRQTKSELNHSLEKEADEYLERVLDEISHGNTATRHIEQEDDPPPEYREAESHTPLSPTSHHLPLSSTYDLPSTPSKDPVAPSPSSFSSQTPSTSADLMTRFTSLSLALPSVPTSLPKSAPLPPPDPQTLETHTPTPRSQPGASSASTTRPCNASAVTGICTVGIAGWRGIGGRVPGWRRRDIGRWSTIRIAKGKGRRRSRGKGGRRRSG